MFVSVTALPSWSARSCSCGAGVSALSTGVSLVPVMVTVTLCVEVAVLVAHRDVVGHRQRLALGEEIEALVGRLKLQSSCRYPVWVLSVDRSAPRANRRRHPCRCFDRRLRNADVLVAPDFRLARSAPAPAPVWVSVKSLGDGERPRSASRRVAVVTALPSWFVARSCSMRPRVSAFSTGVSLVPVMVTVTLCVEVALCSSLTVTS